MQRGETVLSMLCLALAACGGGSSNPDASLVHEVDAAPPDAGLPDAFVCNLTTCDTECVDTTTDPQHCGDCTTACQSGADCVASDCVCPPNFLPATLSPGAFDQVQNVAALGATVAINPILDTPINAFGVGFNPDTVQLDHAYTLNGATLPAPPFALAANDIDIATMTATGAYAAVSGTLTFTTACTVGATGTLTDATFQAADIDTLTLDPQGCSFTLPSITFAIGAECPPPPPPAAH